MENSMNIARAAAQWAMSKKGCQYSQAKRTQDNIFDCSSLVASNKPHADVRPSMRLRGRCRYSWALPAYAKPPASPGDNYYIRN